MQFSVVICTHNRSQLLVQVLDSLSSQVLDCNKFEILIVDNCSNDDTIDIAKHWASTREHLILHVIREEVQGLGYARNTGLSHASGEYVAFLDDDAKADPSWLVNTQQVFNEVNPKPICVGGPILPFYSSKKPEWFKDEYEIRTWGSAPRRLSKDESFSGSNMIWDKRALQEVGGFDVEVGVKGEYLSVGEENVPFYRAWQLFQNPMIYYHPEVRVFHWTPKYKMTVGYPLKRAFSSGQVSPYLRKKKTPKYSRFNYFASNLYSLILLSIKAIFHIRKYKYKQNWLIEEWMPIMSRLGGILAVVGLKFKQKQA